MSIPRWLDRILQHYDVAYEVGPRPPGQADPSAGTPVRTVLLWDRGRPVAVVLPASADLDLGRVGAVLGSPNLRPAMPGEVAGWFKGCRPEAVPPVRLRGDEVLLMDRALAHRGKMTFAAGTPDTWVTVRFRDWWRMVRPGVGHFTPAAPGEADNRPTVLVVEDEPEVNALLCRLLEKEGFAPRGVLRGSEALAVAAACRPAAVLLDLMLPDISGFEVYERMRCPGSLRRPPAVIVTALDSPDARQRGERLGAEAYLTKPFLPRQLVDELREVVADALA
jgi:CheY-like chemotaxis protein/prolyl-tRNA editing enzyme YbaK/EbsC (Cys-tRNA(Pro) deacylase)